MTEFPLTMSWVAECVISVASAGATVRESPRDGRARTRAAGECLRRDRTVQRREDGQTRKPEALPDDEGHGSPRRITDALPFVMDRDRSILRFVLRRGQRFRSRAAEIADAARPIGKDVANVTAALVNGLS